MTTCSNYREKSHKKIMMADLARAGKPMMVGGGILFIMDCAKNINTKSANNQLQFDFRTYFSRPLKAWGTYLDAKGNVIHRFTVDLLSRWEGEIGILEENFVYTDGKKEHRVWKYKRPNELPAMPSATTATGDIKAEILGDTFHCNYDVTLPVDGKMFQVHLDDEMYLVDEQTVINRAVMTKFGCKLGEVMLVMQQVQ